MKWLKRVFLLLVLVIISSCATKPTVQTVTKRVAVLPPDALIQDCVVVPPPEINAYMSVSLSKREGMLWDKSMDQYKAVRKCNINTAGLRKWKAEQQIIFKDSGN